MTVFARCHAFRIVVIIEVMQKANLNKLNYLFIYYYYKILIEIGLEREKKKKVIVLKREKRGNQISFSIKLLSTIFLLISLNFDCIG